MLSTTCHLSVHRTRLLSIAALLAAPLTVTAQDATPETEGNQLEEIVVTGTSLARASVDTPLAVTSFDEKRLSQLTASSQADILNSVPTIKAEGGGGEVAANVFIKGLPSGGQYQFTPLMYDGMPVFSSFGLNSSAFDVYFRNDLGIERLEFVRGGVSNLFGPGSVAGLINYISKTGSDTPERKVQLEVADENRVRGDFALSGPLSSDAGLYYALSGFYRTDDGPIKTGKTFFQSYLSTYKVGFDDTASPATESHPSRIDLCWNGVTDNANVIGDFTWTGWDYLGEAGIGRVDYTDDEDYVATGVEAGYPWLIAWCGDIDITGHRRPISYYREIVYGLRDTPYIAVHRPQFHGRPTAQTPWSWTDSVSSWSWDVPVGAPATVDVYSNAEEVELVLNGRSIDRVRVGTETAFLARFETTYEPGELVAVSYLAGREQARAVLRTADDAVRLVATCDRDAIDADDTDLAYVTVALRDDDGTLATHRDRPVTVQVSGPGVLAGLGSARPRTQEPFGGSRCTTFDGRALAIVRPTGPGEITVHVDADGCEPVTSTILAR